MFFLSPAQCVTRSRGLERDVKFGDGNSSSPDNEGKVSTPPVVVAEGH